MRNIHRFIGVLLAAWFAWSVTSATAANTNSISWQVAADKVSADVHSEALWPLLETIAHQTGWHIFVEPGIDRKADVKFKNLARSEALKKLLGDLNYAFVPQTNGPDSLYVFATVMKNATKPVAAVAKHVPNQLMIKVKPGTDIEALAKSLGAKVVGRNEALGIYLLQFEDAASTDTALAKLKDNPDVAVADYNNLYDAPTAPQQLDGAPVGSISLSLNPPGDSGKVIVGLVDTGVQPLGADLDKFILNRISVAGDGETTSTDLKHATSMAISMLQGIASQGDSTSVQILSVDVYGANETASTWDIVQGIRRVINDGANPINLSLGSPTDSPILDQVIQDAEAKGIVFFAAAGNTPVNTPTYPAAINGVYAVAATQGGQLASYSNYGSFISLALPGSSIVSWGGSTYLVQGTSPATAYASGIAAGTKSATTMTWGQILRNMQQQFPMLGK